MDLTYHGGNCVRVRGKGGLVLVDPPEEKSKVKSDIVVWTSGELDPTQLRGGNAEAPQVVRGAGEFEIRGIPVRGIGKGKNTLMLVEVDDVKIVAPGGSSTALSEEEIEAIGHIDVLLVPLSNMSASEATKLVNTLEPAVAVPVGYASSGKTQTVDEETLKKFAKEMGVSEGGAAQPKLSLSGSMRESEDTRVVILEAKPLS